MNDFLLKFLAFSAIISAILVIISKNPVIAVIFLITLFISSASFLLILGIGFVGLSYIIVYVGALTVLFLFVIMMINIKITEIIEEGYQYSKNLPLAIAIGFLYIYELFTILPFSLNDITILPLIIVNYLNKLIITSDMSFIKDINLTYNPYFSEAILTSFLQVKALGQSLYTYGAFWLIICSVILLLSMFAPIIISRKENSESNK
jgi:NADH-ubiquinone oxidoreductase chain 6